MPLLAGKRAKEPPIKTRRMEGPLSNVGRKIDSTRSKLVTLAVADFSVLMAEPHFKLHLPLGKHGYLCNFIAPNLPDQQT